MKLGTRVGLGPGHIVLDGDPAPPPQKGGSAPQFFAYVYCGQTAGWMQLVLGMEVGLSPGDFVLDGDPVPFPRNGRSPVPQIFGPLVLWRKCCMHQNATWYGARPRLRRLCVRWGPRSPSPKTGKYVELKKIILAYCLEQRPTEIRFRFWRRK